MAIISFGQTFRTNNVGFGLKNNSSSTVFLDAFGINVLGLTTKIIPLDLFDSYSRDNRHTQVYDVKTTGLPYQDDYARLAALIQDNTLSVMTTTYTASSNTFTVGASATPTTAGTSVFFA